MKNLLKKIALTLTFTLGSTMIPTYIQTSAEEKTLALEQLDNYKEVINSDGSITRIIEIPELNIRDEITYNKETGKLIINEETFYISPLPEIKGRREIISEESLSSQNRAAIVWVSEGRTVRSIPIGTTVSAGIATLSILTGVPASKLGQIFLSFSGLALGSILNDELSVIIYQYRSKYQIDGRYKYKHSYHFQWKGSTFHRAENEFYTERP